MFRFLKDELQELKQKLMTCFQEALPSKQFSATLSLSIIWLGVLGDREEQIEDPKERRRIEDEFEEAKKPLKEGSKCSMGRQEETLKRPSRTRSELCPECGGPMQPTGRCFTCLVWGESSCS